MSSPSPGASCSDGRRGGAGPGRSDAASRGAGIHTALDSGGHCCRDGRARCSHRGPSGAAEAGAAVFRAAKVSTRYSSMPCPPPAAAGTAPAPSKAAAHMPAEQKTRHANHIRPDAPQPSRFPAAQSAAGKHKTAEPTVIRADQIPPDGLHAVPCGRVTQKGQNAPLSIPLNQPDVKTTNLVHTGRNTRRRSHRPTPRWRQRIPPACCAEPFSQTAPGAKQPANRTRRASRTLGGNVEQAGYAAASASSHGPRQPSGTAPGAPAASAGGR